MAKIKMETMHVIALLGGTLIRNKNQNTGLSEPDTVPQIIKNIAAEVKAITSDERCKIAHAALAAGTLSDENYKKVIDQLKEEYRERRRKNGDRPK